jgi:hypothetical protein
LILLGAAASENHARRNLPFLTELKNILDFRCYKYAAPPALGRSASCPNSQRAEKQATAGMISTLPGLATRCGLGQTALRENGGSHSSVLFFCNFRSNKVFN